MTKAIVIKKLNKIYDNGFSALTNINLEILQGEIFALLGPNGAGKSTLINIICGMAKKNSGEVLVFNLDNEKFYKYARALIGLVPQEIATDSFEKVKDTIRFTRGLFNKPKSDVYVDKIMKNLSLWDKRDQQIRTLSGGMKRRLMIAKALSHEPKILFLDEPSAGVDVELRKSMWKQITSLKRLGVTIFLTTHYIEEAEQIADRIGIINQGKIILIEEKNALLKKLGEKQIILKLKNRIEKTPQKLKGLDIKMNKQKNELILHMNNFKNRDLSSFLKDLSDCNIEIEDIDVKINKLEDIFISQLED